MAAERAPLLFETRLGGLFPANKVAEEAMREIKGRVSVEIKGGRANQRRRGLYRVVLDLAVPLLNERYNLTLNEDDLHDILRTKLHLYDEIKLPSGEVHRKLKSTSNRAMNEADRAAYTDAALRLLSVWTGVDVLTLKTEAEAA
jgi:hypothetical protein